MQNITKMIASQRGVQQKRFGSGLLFVCFFLFAALDDYLECLFYLSHLSHPGMSIFNGKTQVKTGSSFWCVFLVSRGFRVVLCCVVLCCVVLCRVRLCYVVLCVVVFCCVLWCRFGSIV